MKIFVTGAAGFIGAAVAASAARAGHEVLAVGRPGRANERLAAIAGEVATGEVDLRDAANVRSLVRNFAPDAIIHAAWAGVDGKRRSDRLQITDNVEAACSLVEIGAECGTTKFVGIGSQGEYGPHHKKMSEDDLALPTSLYGAAKLATYHLTRQLAAQANMSYAWIRVFSTFGPGDNGHGLIPSMIGQIMAGNRPKTTGGEQRWDVLYINDLADAVVAVTETEAAFGVFNVGSGCAISVRSIVEKIRDRVRPELELVFGEIPYASDQIWNMEADIGRIERLTRWSPLTGIDEGLSKTVAWHRDCFAATNKR